MDIDGALAQWICLSHIILWRTGSLSSDLLYHSVGTTHVREGLLSPRGS